MWQRGCYLVLAALAALGADTANTGSICVSRADCCSLSPPRDGSSESLRSCCGSALAGPDTISCRADGFCYRGLTPCQSSMDDPLCNIPSAAVTGDELDPLASWRTCRQDSLKMQALQRADLYGGEPLLQSAMFGNLESLESLADEGVGIDARGSSGATALHMASLLPQGNGVVPFLLANGAPVNAIDEFGFTPLHRFIQSQNVEGAAMLLYSGANLTIYAPGGETPLHLAAYENSRELAQLLLAFGANPFARNDRGATSFEVGLFDMLVPPHHMT